MRWNPTGGSISVVQGAGKSVLIKLLHKQEADVQNRGWHLQQPKQSNVTVYKLHERNSRRESGKKAGAFLRDLET